MAGLQALIDKTDIAVAVAYTGQNLSTEVQGGSFAATTAHMLVRADFLAAVAETLDLRPLAAHLLVGRANVEGWTDSPPPWPTYQTTPPETPEAKAKRQTDRLARAERYAAWGCDVDWVAMAGDDADIKPACATCSSARHRPRRPSPRPRAPAPARPRQPCQPHRAEHRMRRLPCPLRRLDGCASLGPSSCSSRRLALRMRPPRAPSSVLLIDGPLEQHRGLVVARLRRLARGRADQARQAHPRRLVPVSSPGGDFAGMLEAPRQLRRWRRPPASP